ncbi:hypothetical protein F5Y05DRAFT_414517 [Hypoxylon sp. FL0543]|nr:hypothetical protein F5Y05DRAFT_414517 [Hypoxylon sp. FL0543]
MPGDTYRITASGNAFVNTGHTYQLESKGPNQLLNLLLPNWRSSGSLELYWDHHQARQKRVGKTGEWLLSFDCFKSWLEGQNSFLWLHGIAGCGKTVLSSTVIDYLRGPLTGDNYTAGYYFNAREDEKRNVSRLLRSLVLQLCRTEEDLPPKLEELRNKSLLHDVSNDDLLEILEALVKRKMSTYIVIDALDECDASIESKEVERLVEFIRFLASLNAPNLHLLVTSREGGLAGPLDRELKRIVGKEGNSGLYRHQLNLQSITTKRKMDEDIAELVESQLRHWNKRKGRRWLPLDKAKSDLISESVKDRAYGMFRLAACLLDLLWRKDSWADVQLALNDLPPELPQVYDRIFDDIKDQGQMKTTSVLLRWLLYSERPLSLEELTELTMADGQETTFDAESGAEDESYVSLTLSSLVTISEEKLVHFAHQTVKDYLLLDTTERGFYARKADSQVFVAKCCLSYMQFCEESDLKCRSGHCSVSCCPEEYKLLEYAFNNWYEHAAKVDTTAQPRHSSSEASLVGDHINKPRQGSRCDGMNYSSEPKFATQSLLEWAASVKSWLDQMKRIEYVPNHSTLKALAGKGYDWFVALLLDRVAARTAVPYKDRSQDVFSATLAGNCKEMVHLFLGNETGGEPEDETPWSETSDSTAKSYELSHESYDTIIRFLLERGLNVARVDYRGRTAVHTAASRGHEIILKVLADVGADINTRDCSGRTALHIASSQGHDAAAQLLLERGADIGVPDILGWTALDFAVQKVIMGFRPEDFHVDIDYSAGGETPQLFRSNNETVARTLRLLLERASNPEIIGDPETPDEACEKGQVDFVRSFQLLGGFTQIGRSLIENFLVNRVVVAFEPVIPLGMWLVNRCFLTFASAQTETVNISKDTVIFSASARIKVLNMSKGTVVFSAPPQVEILNISKGTFIFLASAQVGTLNVSKGSIIFSAPAQVEVMNIHKASAIFSASAQIRDLNIHKGSANFLSPAQIKEATIHKGRMNFTYEIHQEMMRLFRGETMVIETEQSPKNATRIENLEIGSGLFHFSAKVDIGCFNCGEGGVLAATGATALYLAASCEHGAIVRLLLEKRANPNAMYRPDKAFFEFGNRDKDCECGGWTPLHVAAHEGNEAIVQLLLEKKADVGIKDHNGRTARQIAASQGHAAIVRLLENNEFNIDMRDGIWVNGHRVLRKIAATLFSLC